jgi:hypothetical protein
LSLPPERRRELSRERQRRCRVRRRNGVSVLRIVVNEIDLAETLRAANLLSHLQDESRDALQDALQQLIDHWVTRDDAA